MQSDRQLEVTFTSGRSGSGPATWGQQKIWNVVSSLGNDAARYNVTGGSPVSPGITLARADEIFRSLLHLHDSLRTRLHLGDDGQLTQVVQASGAIPVLSRQTAEDDVTENAYALYHELQGRTFDCANEWPLRIGLIEAGGLVRYVIFSMPHTASDGWGLRNLLADFVDLLGSVPKAREDLMQPLEEAAFQLSDRGRRRDAAARRSMLDKLAQGPLCQFPAYAGQPPAPKFPNACLHSPALALALDWIAADLAVTPSSVLLAAASASAGRITGVRDALFQVVVSNRFLPGLATGVNVVANEGFFFLPDIDKDFADVIRRAFGATLSTQRHAYYDKLTLDREIEQRRSAGEAVADYSCVINDTRGLMPILNLEKASPEPLSEAVARTVLTWPVEFEPRTYTTFALGAGDARGALELSMTADSALVPKPDMERFLYGIEDLVVTQALALGAP